MKISIGGRPLSKVALGLGSAVGIAVVVAILSAGTTVLNLSPREWVALLIAAATPPTLAFFKSLNSKDLTQILNSVPPDVLDDWIRLAQGGAPVPSSIASASTPTPPPAPTTRHDSPY